ncbi:MAG: tripartite tricarboxylate transporter substrate binding protein, partial [Advenella sp.]
MNIKPLRCLLGAAALIVAGTAAAAWPEKPITMVVPFPAGSGTDSVGRIFAREMTSRLGQQV